MREKRSFLPVNVKPVKALHFRGDGAKYLGENEPNWPSVEEQKKWSRSEFENHFQEALSWYAQTQDDNQIVNLAMISLGLSGHFTDLPKAINNSMLPFSITGARIIRMAHCGMFIPFKERRFIVKAIRKCIKHPKEVEISSEISVKAETIQDRINIKMRRIKGEIDEMFDAFIKENYTYGGLKAKENISKSPLPIVSQILSEPEFTVPPARIKELTDYCQKYLNEYKDALKGKEPLAEAYPIGKRHLKAAIAWWEQAIIDITSYNQQKKKARKPRARKQKSPNQLVSKLKFMREFPDLKLKSIDPTALLKSSELWIYNTHLRKLGHFVAMNGMSFDIKGTKFTNLDPVKSVQKTLRKPAEQLKEFNNYSKVGAVKWFNNIRAIATQMRAGLNKDCILLRSVK